MNQQLLQQALNEAKADAIEVFTYEDGIAQSARDAIEYMHSWLGVYFEKQALAQQEQPASDLPRNHDRQLLANDKSFESSSAILRTERTSLRIIIARSRVQGVSRSAIAGR